MSNEQKPPADEPLESSEEAASEEAPRTVEDRIRELEDERRLGEDEQRQKPEHGDPAGGRPGQVVRSESAHGPGSYAPAREPRETGRPIVCGPRV